MLVGCIKAQETCLLYETLCGKLVCYVTLARSQLQGVTQKEDSRRAPRIQDDFNNSRLSESMRSIDDTTDNREFHDQPKRKGSEKP